MHAFTRRACERLLQSRSKVLTVRVSAEDMERLDALARRVLLYAAGVYHIEPPETGEIAELTKEVSAIGRKIPRMQLDQLAHQLQQIAWHNEKARNLMVRRA